LIARSSRRTDPLHSVDTEFRRNKLLLESDPLMPSVASIVAGERIKGSWWGHAKGRVIWRVLNEFTGRKDVLVTRLVSGKITFVHRSLWNDFLRIASSKERWQTRDLSTDAKQLLQLVEKEGALRTDVNASRLHLKGKIGDVSRELERKLLIHSSEMHTEKGAHAKVLESWSNWIGTVNVKPKHVSLNRSKSKFEAIIGALNKEHGAKASLPWAKEEERRTARV